jgi:hypothetical protein
MADVLLAHSNHLFHDRKQAQKVQPYSPPQTLLAAALRALATAFHLEVREPEKTEDIRRVWSQFYELKESQLRQTRAEVET